MKSGMNRKLLVGVLLVGIALSGACSDVESGAKEVSSETHVELREGWYYINGNKFFVNALGYEIGARPGQHPYKKRWSEPERVKSDLAVIKEAGFNAIRTWSELSEEELNRRYEIVDE